MYATGTVDIPSILDSLPVAGTDSKGIASFDSSYFSVTNGKVTLLADNVGLNESELAEYLNTNNYAKKSDIPSLNGYATQSWVESKGYALNSDLMSLTTKVDDFLEGSDTDTIINKWLELEAFLSGLSESDNLATILSAKADKDYVDDTFVTLTTAQTITGEKNFTGGLKVNGSPIYYDTEKKYWKLEGDLLVTGGVTMYGNEGTYTPSTIMDAIAVDGTTISKSGGVLKVIGGTGGGVADSVAWANITGKPTFATVATSGKYSDLSGTPSSLPASDVYSWAKASTKPSYSWSEITSKPTWIGSSKPTYSYSEITGAISTTELQNYLTQNSYLNVTSGDNRYLKLSGGTISSTGNTPLGVTSQNGSWVGIEFTNKDSKGVAIGVNGSNPCFVLKDRSAVYTLLHSNNIGSYAWTSSNDGEGSGLDADLLDGQEGSWYIRNVLTFQSNNGTDVNGGKDLNSLNYGIVSNYGSYGYWANAPTGMTYGMVLNLKSSLSNKLMGQLAWDINHRGADSTRYLYWRANDDRNFATAKWHQIAFTDSNVASATKLQTARTIWGQSFDGTGNVSGALSDVTGITFKDDYYGLIIDAFGNFSFKKPYSTTATDWSFKDSSGNKLIIINNSGNVGIGTTSPQQKLHIEGNIWANGDIAANTKIHSLGTLIAAGNVGIGTESPSAKLHIVNNTNTSTGLRLDGGWSGYGFLYNAINIFLNGEQYGGIGVNTISSAYGSTATAGTYITNAKSGEYMNFYNEGGTFLKSSLLVNGGITMYSDQRKKTILNHVELSLKQIAEAPLIEHYYNNDDKKTTHVGSIAQYWAEMNDWFCKKDSEGYYTMEIQNAALASAISIARELDRYETKTDKAIKKLKKRICELEEEVERLKSA